MDDVRIVHADASVGDESPDRLRPVRPVDRVLIAIESQGPCPHGIVRGPSGDNVRQPWIIPPHLVRRRPGRLHVFSVDPCMPGPLLAGPAYSDGIAPGRAVTADKIEPALLR